ncbi:hypothetical protein PZE06_01280 [Robertmurraya sp. DFI.2.37]|uniref:hypothetical protein n=1 Tax=Robertmurraya sp. DFI.2.37 TaxID=3031819 RepID=UPI0012479EB4|nr:hypothetical protein [Robertmurraya sp. DFI.2.37]MDF1506806.1 hypothetical protein [Robertmurraya sp. DFI.2.37]
MDAPPLHPSWLIHFWLSTPGLNKVDPHLMLVIVITIIVVIFLIRRKKRSGAAIDQEEVQFQHLLKKKQMLEQELLMLQHDGSGETSRKQKELERQLRLTKGQLREFT